MLHRHCIIRILSLCFLAAGIGLAACSDNDVPPIKPTLPATNGSAVRSIRHLGNMPMTYDWLFRYAAGRLTSAQGTRRTADAAPDDEFSYAVSLAYNTWAVVPTLGNGTRLQVKLNSRGYVESLAENEDTYEFWYENDMLTRWKRTDVETSYGGTQEYVTEGKITYSNGDLKKIVYTGVDKQPVVYTFTATQEANTNGLLPVGAERALGCLGIEYLYYAGLMGRATTHLVQSMTAYDNATESVTERFTYSYSRRGSNVELCNYTAKDGSIGSVYYEY